MLLVRFCDPWEVRLLLERKDDSETSNSKLCRNNFNEPILLSHISSLSLSLLSSFAPCYFAGREMPADPGWKNDFRFTRLQTKLLSLRQRYSISVQQQHTVAHRRHTCMENSVHFRDNTIVTTLIYIPAASTRNLDFSFSLASPAVRSLHPVFGYSERQLCETVLWWRNFRFHVWKKKKKLQRIASIYLEF